MKAHEIFQDTAGVAHGQPQMLVEPRSQAQGSMAQMGLGRPDGSADLHGMRAPDLPAARTDARIGHQTRDVGTNQRQVFDELFTRFDTDDGPATTRTTVQFDLNVVIHLRRF